MLISPDSRFVVSHLGWVDKSALWIYDNVKESVNLVRTGNAKYLALYPCKDENLFAVFHHFDGSLIRLTVHSFENPTTPLCSIEHAGGKTTVQGNPKFLQSAPHYYVAYYNPEFAPASYLIYVDYRQSKIETGRFEWYNNNEYDLGYQGIIGVFKLDSGNLIVSIQRDSHPVIYDPFTKTVIGKLTLAGNSGNPKFQFVRKRGEIWADDYDTILKFDNETLALKASRRIQGALMSTYQLIGDWSFNKDESLCLVSRPFSGDVIAISTDDLKTMFVAKTGKQPIQAIFVSNEKIIGRDWQTGALLKGTFQRRWF